MVSGDDKVFHVTEVKGKIGANEVLHSYRTTFFDLGYRRVEYKMLRINCTQK